MSKTSEDAKGPFADDDLPYAVACREGDTEAFAVLVQRHSQTMLNLACRMLGDYDEACDVVQDAFLAAFRSLGRFRGEAKFSTWLYRIAVNVCKNRLKARQVLAGRESALPDNAGAPEGCPVCLGTVDDNDPSRFLERQELHAQVQKCISALDMEFRDVLVLRDIQGFAYEEIREILKIPDGTVKSRLSRARLAMKDCLKKVMSDL